MAIKLKSSNLNGLDEIECVSRLANDLAGHGEMHSLDDETLFRAAQVISENTEALELVNIVLDQHDSLKRCVADADYVLSCYWGDGGVIDVEKMKEWIAGASECENGSIFKPAFFIELIEKSGQMALDKSLARHLSSAGTNGGKTKNKPAAELKAWALERAKTMKGRDIDIASDLVASIPSHLAEVSGNPHQLIYRALLARYPAKSSR